MKRSRINNNVSLSKSVKKFQALSHQILEYSNRGDLRTDFQREISKMLLSFSGCNAVEFWLKGHGKYFRSEMNHLPGKPFLFDIRLYTQNENGDIVPGPNDHQEFIDLCNSLIHGLIDPSQPLVTKNGSFLIGNAKKPFSLCLKSDKKSHIRHFHIANDYQSLLLIPLSVGGKNIGLLGLKSKYRDYFKKNEILLCEDLSRDLEIAATHRDAKVDLRERIKELTCLYSIARLAAQPDLSMKEILQGIVKVLPPAWFYPEIAHARIILNGNSFLTLNFQEGRCQQRADIIISGEHRGIVEVVYIDERPELDEGPFLQEERALLDTVAKEIANIIIGKQAEQEKLNLEEQLRHADRLATIGQLAAGVAHELNEPLGSILGFSQLAKKSPGLSNQVDQDIEKILNASLYAREIVKKLLIFARQMPPKKIKVNLNQLVEEGLHFFKSRCSKEGIELVCSLCPDLPEIDADPSQLNQVVINLMVNALQAMPHGGMLKVQTLFGGNQVSLIIEDTGMGMSEEVLRKIFTPFFTTKEVGKGTGLGLPVVHGIITSHGGSMGVESKVGQGTRFEIHFPMTKMSINES
jgi:signal transduction histidine kinase